MDRCDKRRNQVPSKESNLGISDPTVRKKCHWAFAPVMIYVIGGKSFFLAAAACKNLEDDFYMSNLEGYNEAGQEQKVSKLNKAIYGLKLVARVWHIRIEESPMKYGWF
ncbi:hypothetical protein AVEN_251628-1 [Araneus ventricosus]|uniref:Reverse transcriptase Ty1/copia-type domain-containing protein n=1 Tax=Araneus ventricosus TaxID=182803 RepID=A0A4Y2WY07_ARAVE|nr:hypothetical protein AVEN_251628-1 [Araneus ventricosus]